MGPKVARELIFSGEIRCLSLWIGRVPKGRAEFALVDAPRALQLRLPLEVAATQGEVAPHPGPLPSLRLSSSWEVLLPHPWSGAAPGLVGCPF